MGEPGPSTSKNDSSDTFKILLATDCHLGYEAKTKRAQDMDSFITFEEILQKAVQLDADFILLGGDLFHDAKPSQKVLLQCMNLLKKYCLGSKQIQIKFLSNPEEIFFQSAEKKVNYEDENMNISMPVFSIHGNHDNPSFESTGSLDLLQASGLVNYFGKWNNLQEITVTPMIFQKGNSYVAIYGIGHVGEQRLSRLFKDGKIRFLKPKDIPNCFNILVLHQNRARHTENDYIADDKLPGWFDFIFWGHEHECFKEVTQINTQDNGSYYICQPGSSVATSLCEGEAKKKHVFLLKIRQHKFRLSPQELKTVRPFIFKEIVLSEKISKDYCEPSPEGIYEYIDDFIENTCIPEAQRMIADPRQPKEPLIRIKVYYTEDSQIIDTPKLCRKYCDQVANPKDLILFRKERAGGSGKGKSNDHADDLAEELAECFRHNAENEHDWSNTVQSGIKKYFDMKDYKLKVLTLTGMNEALNRCIVHGDEDVFAEVVEHQIRKSVDYLKNKDIELKSDVVLEELRKYHEERAARNGEDSELREVQGMLDDPAQRGKNKWLAGGGDADGVDADDDDAAPAASGRGRGRAARGSRARGTSTRARGRGKNALDVTASPAPAPKRAASTRAANATSRTNTSVFDRFTNPLSQSRTSTQAPRSQRPNVRYVESSDED